MPLTPMTFDSPLTALVTIAQRFNPDFSPDNCTRTINFMTYELQANADTSEPENCYQKLNHYFFEHKNFKRLPAHHFLNEILAERGGCPIALALLYIHLGQSLGLRLKLVHWPLHAILHWDDNGLCHYIDLEHNGKILDEDELLQIINKHKDQVRTLNLTESIVQYLAYLAMQFRQQMQLEKLHEALTLILQVEPENTRFLAERALLRKELGLTKESLADFKRYFAFTEASTAPNEMAAAYQELCGPMTTS